MAHLITGNKFDPEKDIPDLSGKVVHREDLYIVPHILQHDAAKIILLSQKEEHAKEAMEGLEQYGDANRVEWIQLDLNDSKQTNEVAKKLANEQQIDALVCNAGEGVGRYNETIDGLDSHFQVNHLSQFHLLRILLPVLQRTSGSRLVLQSSDLHRGCPSTTKFTAVQEINTGIGPMNLYNRTKLAQVLTVRALVQRMENNESGFQSITGMGSWINATHPGGVKTDQQQQAVDAYGTIGKIGVNSVKPFMKDPVGEGCRPALFAARSEDVIKEGIQVQYIVPDRKVTEPSSMAKDVALGENLWRLSEQILTEKLGMLPYAYKT